MLQRRLEREIKAYSALVGEGEQALLTLKKTPFEARLIAPFDAACFYAVSRLIGRSPERIILDAEENSRSFRAMRRVPDPIYC